MLARALSASVLGVDGVLVRVEVDVAFGLPGLTIVGLAGSAVQEARERVRSAIRNTGFEVPARRVTVNLAPADLPKEGTGYDVAIAVAMLVASGQLRDGRMSKTALIAELALDGHLQPVPGTMALVAACRDAGIADAIVAPGSLGEAASVGGIRVRAAAELGDVVAHLAGVRDLPAATPTAVPPWTPPDDGPDLADVIGQPLARRALEIAIAGRHSLALCGPPGVGKTMLLRCAPTLMPPLGDQEAIDVSRIYSVAGLLDRRAPLVRTRPFRAPHHTISTQALVGGGARVRPGEASLAHRGTLLLDETLLFRADALEALRQPLESGSVTIARVDGVLSMPARFLLLAAFNPCPCGWLAARARQCTCDEATKRRYAARLSGPLRDRLDLFVPMDEPSLAGASDLEREPSEAVASRVARAWRRQIERQGRANAELADISGALEPRLARRLASNSAAFQLSPRRVHRAVLVARTIADLEGSEAVEDAHLNEALGYRVQRGAAA